MFSNPTRIIDDLAVTKRDEICDTEINPDWVGYGAFSWRWADIANKTGYPFVAITFNDYRFYQSNYISADPEAA